MSKMLWELELPVMVAEAKEDFSKNNICKYMRYIKMFMSRYRLKAKYDGIEQDITYDYFSKILFGGKVGIIKDPVYGVCVGKIDVEKEDANGGIEKLRFEYNNGKSVSGKKVGKDVVVIEDLISTAGSSIEVVNVLREAGCNVLGIASIFTYNLKYIHTYYKKY